MIVTIHEQKELAQFFLQDNIPKIILEPQKMYHLRIYLEEKEEEVHVVPIERDNLVVLRFYTTEQDGPSKPPKPKGAKQLLLYVQFKVDNDFAIPRVVRWAFRIKKGTIHSFDLDQDSFNKVLQTLQEEREFFYETQRIPLFVKPKKRSKFLVIASLVGAVFISEMYELFRHAIDAFAWPYFLKILVILISLSIFLWGILWAYAAVVPHTYEDNIS